MRGLLKIQDFVTNSKDRLKKCQVESEEIFQMFVLKLDTIWNSTLQFWQNWDTPLRIYSWQNLMNNSVLKCPIVGNKPDKLGTKKLRTDSKICKII
jgi:hypothetical protein